MENTGNGKGANDADDDSDSESSDVDLDTLPLTGQRHEVSSPSPHPSSVSSVASSPSSSVDRPPSMRRVLGYMGLTNMCILGVFLILPISVSGVYSITSLSLTYEAVLGILFVGIIDNVFADYLWAKAVVYTDATVATIGLALTVPSAVASDYLWGREIVTERLFAAAGVCIGFFMVNL